MKITKDLLSLKPKSKFARKFGARLILMTFVTALGITFAACNSKDNGNNQITESQSQVSTTQDGNNESNKGLTEEESDNVNSDQSKYDSDVGLLLGLSKKNSKNPNAKYLSDYETIWISLIDGKVSYEKKDGFVLVPDETSNIVSDEWSFGKYVSIWDKLMKDYLK